MSRQEITHEIAIAAGRDAGNRSMRANGRTAWNDDDWNTAASETNRLLASKDGAERAEDPHAYMRHHRSQINANLEENGRNLKEGRITKKEHSQRKRDGRAALNELAQDARKVHEEVTE